DKLVTGVQTCALPIYAVDGLRLEAGLAGEDVPEDAPHRLPSLHCQARSDQPGVLGEQVVRQGVGVAPGVVADVGVVQRQGGGGRSEERRVGKECRWWW